MIILLKMYVIGLVVWFLLRLILPYLLSNEDIKILNILSKQILDDPLNLKKDNQ